jgi:integrase
MDMKVYKKTRYQNIYKHKNGNYVVMINKPVKSSISRIDGEKIWKIDEALKIRDNPKTGFQKKIEIEYKDNFDVLFEKYLNWCVNIDKQSYNNTSKKKIKYNAFLKNKFKRSLNKITTDEYALVISKLNTTDKQKNSVLKLLNAFLNWCVKNNILLYNPASSIKKYKVVKAEMKYWEQEDISKFFKYMNKEESENAYRIKIMVLIGLSLGDRIGETRVLTFGSIDKKHKVININHSINYDPNSDSFFGSTKTYSSQRSVDISDEFINEIDKYRTYLEKIGYNITDKTLLFLNHKTQRPYSDSLLRQQFYSYCDKAEVPRIRMYDLRHTYVTTMLSENIPLAALSKTIGHTTFKTTVDKYGHISEKTRKEITKITDKFLFQK